jgi:hypothetical protein
MAAMTQLSFNIGPYGKNVQVFNSETNKSIKNKHGIIVLMWSAFKIMCSDPDLHPRWLPSANIVSGVRPLAFHI